MGILPKVKSTISSFLLGEEGRISKEAVLSLGVLMAAPLGASAVQAATTCTLTYTEPPPTQKGECTHTSCHSSHTSGCGCGCY